MCGFLSAVVTNKGRKNERWYYLTRHLIDDTPRGKLLVKKYGGSDLIGHSTIREYFNLEERGQNWEQTDFSTPDNFPAVIVEAIKRGEFRGFGEPEGLLSAPAWKAYNEATNTAEKAYYEATNTAWKAYNEAKAPAEKAYYEAKAPAWKAYNEAKATFWGLFAIPENRNPAWR
jgi:hypothetical protein